ncbi:hypothetical protein HBB16_21935 [Pseudonocardia sp. MCCB 268]|nr:hypothetical protein [Pseudonocardia cytotoxica]
MIKYWGAGAVRRDRPGDPGARLAGFSGDLPLGDVLAPGPRGSTTARTRCTRSPWPADPARLRTVAEVPTEHVPTRTEAAPEEVRRYSGARDRSERLGEVSGRSSAGALLQERCDLRPVRRPSIAATQDPGRCPAPAPSGLDTTRSSARSDTETASGEFGGTPVTSPGGAPRPGWLTSSFTSPNWCARAASSGWLVTSSCLATFSGSGRGVREQRPAVRDACGRPRAA